MSDKPGPQDFSTDVAFLGTILCDCKPNPVVNPGQRQRTTITSHPPDLVHTIPVCSASVGANGRSLTSITRIRAKCLSHANVHNYRHSLRMSE